ncbi:hypothetical protein ABFX02_08G192752 [Erythranthe guttata]
MGPYYKASSHLMDGSILTPHGRTRIIKNGKPISSLRHSRSSGLRVSAAAGSTAAMHLAGESTMLVLSNKLQYMVRGAYFSGSHLTLYARVRKI